MTSMVLRLQEHGADLIAIVGRVQQLERAAADLAVEAASFRLTLAAVLQRMYLGQQ
jgi:hypothetical protein